MDKYKKEKMRKSFVLLGGFFIFLGLSLVMIIGALIQMGKE